MGEDRSTHGEGGRFTGSTGGGGESGGMSEALSGEAQIASEQASTQTWASTTTSLTGTGLETNPGYGPGPDYAVLPPTGQQSTVAQYVEGNGLVNDQLREGTLPMDGTAEPVIARSEEMATEMDAAIAAQAPTTADTILYRGIAHDEEEFVRGGATPPAYQAMANGEVGADLGYSSMSTELPIAQEFAMSDGTVMEIHVPAGAQGLYIPPAIAGNEDLSGDFAYQNEVVLGRGAEYEKVGERPATWGTATESPSPAVVVVNYRPGAGNQPPTKS